ncbi:MAG: DUF2461 domain-containing protein [Chitinophagaceae bacterium]|nr:DUF2461 domain-containing protein [Chitinophagaceae bacterium]
MIQTTTFAFLKQLKNNNNKAWFEAHRKQYEDAKTNLYQLVEELIKAIGKFDAPIGQLAVKDCVFRINRDIRFSKDKTPYKSNMACYFNAAGKNGRGGGYYLHLEPGKTMAGGGIWMPEAPVLAGIRQEIDYNWKNWKKTIENKNFRETFTEGVNSSDTLTRPPKGYDENNRAIAFLKMKSFVVTRPYTDAEAQNKTFVTEVAKTFKTMKPFIDFLNTALH